MSRLRILLAILYEPSLVNFTHEINLDILANELLEDFVGANVRGCYVYKQNVSKDWRRFIPLFEEVSKPIGNSKFHYFDTDVGVEVATLYIARVRGSDVEIIGPW